MRKTFSRPKVPEHKSTEIADLRNENKALKIEIRKLMRELEEYRDMKVQTESKSKERAERKLGKRMRKLELERMKQLDLEEELRLFEESQRHQKADKVKKKLEKSLASRCPQCGAQDTYEVMELPQLDGKILKFCYCSACKYRKSIK